MSDTSKASPRPWHSSGRVYAGPDRTSILIQAKGVYVARLFTQDGPQGCNSLAPNVPEADAALIVQAVNAHDGLIEVLRKARGHIEELGIGYHVEGNHDGPWASCPLTCQTERSAIIRIDAALAAAEGKGQ